MNDPNVIEFIRLLAKTGWSQSEAARKLEITPAVVTRYVRGQTRPSLTTIKLFKVLVGDFGPLPGSTRPIEGLKIPDRILEDWESELLRELRTVESEARRQFVFYIRGLAGILPRKPLPLPPEEKPVSSE